MSTRTVNRYYTTERNKRKERYVIAEPFQGPVVLTDNETTLRAPLYEAESGSHKKIFRAQRRQVRILLLP